MRAWWIIILVAFSTIAHAQPARELDVSLAARPALLEKLRVANDTGDAARVSSIRLALANDARARAVRIHDAWMSRRNPTTKLFPQSPSNPEFNYRNTAADFFGFQLVIALDEHLPSVPQLRDTLAAERALNPAGTTGGLCRAIDSRTGALLDQPLRERLFSTSEYLKDGLIPLYERTGDPAVLTRMNELAEAIIAASAVSSKFGPIPSRDSEINGDVLQSFARLGFIRAGADHPTGDDPVHRMLGTIADAIVSQMLANPAAPGAPLHFYDYATDRFPSGTIRLRDHGNETAVGLAEAFATAVALRDVPAWHDRADRWAPTLARMYELLLERGVNSDGLLVTALSAGGGAKEFPGSPLHQPVILDAEPCDNWGYLLAGVLLFVQAEQRHGALPASRLDALLARADAVALAVTRTDNLRWEGDNPDGFADSIESALHYAAHRPALRARLLAWCDSQFVHLFRTTADAFEPGDYLDGNIIRTCLMYSDARRSISPRTEPPSPPSHMHLPWNWPRINSWPDQPGSAPSP